MYVPTDSRQAARTLAFLLTSSLAVGLFALPIAADEAARVEPDPVLVRGAPSFGVADFTALDTTLFSAAFDDGTTSGLAVDGLWRVTDCQAASGPYSLGYNTGPCPPNFNVGYTTGSALTPGIAIPATALAAALTFESWYQTEDTGTTWDRKLVDMSTDGGASWSTLLQISGTNLQWTTQSVDLAPWIGMTVLVRFRFDSMDGVGNAFEGWYVDNVALTANVPGGGGGGGGIQVTFDDGTTGGFTVDGLWHVSDCRSASAPFSLAYNTGPCPPNFNVGHTSGNAVSPALTSATGATITLTYDSWYQTEDTFTSWDQKLVQASTDDGATWTTVDQVSGTNNAWTTRTVDLSSFAGGGLLVRFRFDSIDSIGNAFEGWYIDNVNIAGLGGGGPPLGFPFAANFDDGTPGTIALDGLWHVGDCQASSLPFSLAYNTGPCPPNFNVGASSGSATLPAIALPAGTPGLIYNSWHETEFGSTYDQKLVQVSTDGGVTWTTLQQVTEPMGAWTERQVSLAAYAGQTVQVRFFFNSVDSVANGGQGWYVDDISLDIIILDPPSAPTFPYAYTGPGVGEITATWWYPDTDGGSPITHYTVYRATSASGPWTAAGTTTGLGFVDPGLGNGQTYCYQVTASNAIGESPASDISCATTFDVPSAPLLASAAAGPGAGEITTLWNSPTSDGGLPLQYFNVYAADAPEGPFGLIAATGALDFVESGLANAQTRFYQMTAVNAAGEGPTSEVVSATTFDVPSVPLDVDAHPGDGLGQVEIGWSVPDSDGGTPITGYNVYRSTSRSSGYELVGSTDADQFSLTDDGDLLRTYHYLVTALNIAGESDPSAGDCSKPFPWVELPEDNLCWLPSPP